jgi:hypothetical protein
VQCRANTRNSFDGNNVPPDDQRALISAEYNGETMAEESFERIVVVDDADQMII